MSRLVATIDLSAAQVGTTGEFFTQTVNNCSALYFMNESSCFLKLDLGINGQPIQQAWYNRKFDLPQNITQVTYTVIAILESGSAPASVLYVEALQPNEVASSAVLDGPIFRQSNLGNTVPVGTSSTAVQNDGNVAPTSVVEATPSGASSSQLKWNNDGSGVFGGGNASVSNAGIFTLPASAIPVASLAPGTLPSGVTVPTAQLSGSIAASLVGSGYPAADIGAGTLPSSVHQSDLYSDGGAIASNGAGQLTTAHLMMSGTGVLGKSTNGDILDIDANGALYLKAASGQNIHFQVPSGSDVAEVTSAGAFTGSLTPPNGGALHGINHISGSGSATVNHGLNTTPSAALINNNAGSNSTTFGSGSYTSSTVYVYQFSAMAWTGVVYV